MENIRIGNTNDYNKNNPMDNNASWLDKDVSLFADDRLNDLLRSNKTNNGASTILRTRNESELFNDINVLGNNSENIGDIGCFGATPLTEHLPFALDNNNTLFSEININGEYEATGNDYGEYEKTKHESEDIFMDGNDEFDKMDDEVLQNTQQFLNDLSKGLLSTKSLGHLDKNTKKEDVKKSAVIRNNGGGGGCIIQGTQYETREEIRNRTFRNDGHNNDHIPSVIDKEDISNLSNINWESQFFGASIDMIPKKGDFYNLPDKVAQLILEHKGIKKLYEWQNECLNLSAVRQRKNLIYALPTSGGKTLVAEILMLREIICRGKNVLFILPYVSIVQEKVSSMSPFAIALDFLIEEYTAGKGKCPPTKRRKRSSIYIASIEKAAVLLDSLIEVDRANEIGLVVVDELHLIGERGRGATLEMILTKVMYINANIQIIGMSATIGNLEEISQFLNADVYTRGFRPVELKEHIKCGRDILEINYAGTTLEDIFTYRRSVHFNYSEAVQRNDPDHLAGLVTECSPQQNCLIFCSTRKNCENVAVLLSRTLPKFKFLEYRKNEKADLMDALDKICGVLSPALARTIPYGVAYHHSGLTTDERKFIETAYRFGVLCVICCTSTLAAGVNLPAKRVIIRAPYVGSTFMSLCKYKQMVGRAGRAGYGDAGESILICSNRDNVKVGEMLFSPMDKAISSLDEQNQLGLQSLILSSIGLGIAACLNDLYRLIGQTLLSVQMKRNDNEIMKADAAKVKQIVKDMFKHKILKMSKGTLMPMATTGTTTIPTPIANDESGILTLQHVVTTTTTAATNKTIQGNNHTRQMFIDRSTKFELTTIGKAAFKAGIDYNKTHIIYEELKNAQQHLILSNYSHLLYLIIAFHSSGSCGDELFSADAAILFDLYQQLDDCTLRLFHMLGFTEAYAARMAKTLSIQGPLEKQMNRLYKVLILNDILNIQPLPFIAKKFHIERGILQNLTSQTLMSGSALIRLCDEISEFWCFKPLFEEIVRKLDRCGTMELEPLLELPAVKINRAKQLYSAGFKTIEDIAKARPIELAQAVTHMPIKIAKEIISAAKLTLMKKLDHLEEETELIKVCLITNSLPET